ncbi:prepilin-type N-terminal cleavage/methylation domain-containing protein [Parashewanella curva]|uniref:Prepilin-type N-terminal cleavage/methylation domain-containing protein n=1 Tax=Parashewanella curva TaxID=2338552 RepID=A0A3L8Q2K2_9GAMM|nr:prepilin-type N-terminal cleavage/methylation domain-containing protein [Parashewanella curva]RLV60652.1 prepilin-type N-terminal cleavage/methylation domain-containing protein [Parashewanella curva]
MSKQTAGFTLIELVVVIVILGVLAVTAAPKFINFSDDAYKAKNQGFFSAFSGAVKLYESKATIAGLGENGKLTISGHSILFYNHWPECASGAQCNVNDGDGLAGKTECEDLWGAIMSEPIEEYTALDDRTTWTCRFRLKEDPSIGFNYQPRNRILEIIQ